MFTTSKADREKHTQKKCLFETGTVTLKVSFECKCKIRLEITVSMKTQQLILQHSFCNG